MRKYLIPVFLVLACACFRAVGQQGNIYSKDVLEFSSEYLQHTITLNLHLPETHLFAAETTRYPITIIFDSQHERTYPHIINSLDLLTNETQIPETIIVGVPFNMGNRRYLTSNQRMDGDSIAGIERMALFLFEELLPMLRTEFKGNAFLTLIGHSRTAYLVNYLTYQRPAEINLAISLSGFFDEEEVSLSSFHSLLTDPRHFPQRFQYFYTAGTSLEEQPYYLECKTLDSLLALKESGEKVKTTFIPIENANHLSNYWTSLPLILMNAFSSYNAILDTWLQQKLDSVSSKTAVAQFKADVINAGKEAGIIYNPGLTHIYSLTSHFAHQRNDYPTAIAFLEYGLDFYPEYLDFYVELIAFCKMLDDSGKLKMYKAILQKKVEESPHISQAEKEEYLMYLEGIQEDAMGR